MGDAVMIAGGAVVAVGATVGLLAVFRDRARGRRRCPKCWYAVGDAEPLRCPECGYEATRERDLYRTRRHWRWAMTGLLVVLAGGALLVTPKVRRDGVWSIMPDTVLVAALPHADGDAPGEEILARLERADAGQRDRYAVMDDWKWDSVRRTCRDVLASDQPASKRIVAAKLLQMTPHHRLGPLDGLGETLAAVVSDPSIWRTGVVNGLLDSYDALSDEDVVIVLEALAVLARGSGTSQNRSWAISAIVSANPRARARFAPQLVELLGDEDVQMRQAATHTLGAVLEPDERTVRAVLALVADPDEDVRFAVFVTLGSWSWRSGDRRVDWPLARPVRDRFWSVPLRDEVRLAMVSGLDDPSRQARFAATRSLHGLRDPSPAIVTRLIELAQGDVVFDTAVGTLGSYGPAAIEALPVLEMRADEQATGDRLHALAAIGAVGAGREDVLETLLAALDADDAETQRGAALGLVHFPEAADRIIEPLLALLVGDPSIMHAQVFETLASYGAAAESALPRIREFAGHDSGLEISAMYAWWRIGGDAEPVLPFITRVIEEWKYGSQATQLLSTLAEMGPAARPALPALRAALRHEPKRAYRESILVTIEAIEGHDR